MNKKVILFCGVESTGKSTAIQKIYQKLTSQGYRCEIVSEVGRDVCALSGGVDDMTLLDYELILHKHQTKFLESLYHDCDIVLLDTDSTYTRYYLEKDNSLYVSNKDQSEYIVSLSEKICLSNIANNRISHVLYLNSDCKFVQDGTRTYEKTRENDDKILEELYRKFYNKNCTFDKICGSEWNNRTQEIFNKLSTYLH